MAWWTLFGSWVSMKLVLLMAAAESAQWLPAALSRSFGRRFLQISISSASPLGRESSELQQKVAIQGDHAFSSRG